MMKNIRIGDVLIAEGYATEAQIADAIAVQKNDPAKRRLGQILLDNRIINEDQMLQALATRLNVKYVTLINFPIEINAVARIPKQVASKYTVIAIAENESQVTVALNDPLDFYAIEDVRSIVNKPLNIILCKRAEIEKLIAYWYSELDAHNAAKSANEAVENVSTVNIEDLSTNPDDTPVVTLVNSILLKAHNAGASDIHIEPFDKHTSVRVRIDGQILDYLTLSSALHSLIVSRIKILSSLDIAEKRLPQDGHFRTRLNNVELNVRVSILPTIYGEKAVLRFLSLNTTLDHSETYGMSVTDYNKISDILQSPHGIIYITGPTGSGKTTTLYMILERLAQKNVNISTIEDPVERNLERINQTQTNVQAGLTFESGLRSLLRQDPDVIMVGETRDNETASIAVSAALTGHLVLSTLHTNDAVSAIVRLQDMGVEKYMIANSLIGVVAQRLAKKICPYCKTAYQPTQEEIDLVGLPVTILHKGTGCNHCSDTGYKGRIAIHEILAIDPAVRSMVTRGMSVEQIQEQLLRDGKMQTLRQSLAKLVAEGVSTVEELLKLTYTVE